MTSNDGDELVMEGVGFTIYANDGRPGVSFYPDDADAERLAIALIQATPNREDSAAYIKDYTDGSEYIYIPDDVSGTYGVHLSPEQAVALGLELIRLAKEAK